MSRFFVCDLFATENKVVVARTHQDAVRKAARLLGRSTRGLRESCAEEDRLLCGEADEVRFFRSEGDNPVCCVVLPLATARTPAVGV
jgi:hypothetical protein